MKIDIVLGRAIGRGGLEKVLTIVSNELHARGHKVRVFQMYEPDYKDWAESLPEIHYYYKQAKTPGRSMVVDEMARGYGDLISNIGKPDVVLATHTPLFSLVCKKAFEHLNIESPPIISWLHGPPEAYGGGELLRYSTAHLAISHNIARKLEMSVASKTAIHHVGNPVDMTHSISVSRPVGNNEFIYVGRLDNREKRLDVLFEALSRLKGEWNLNIFGDGPDKNQLEKISVELGIKDRIVWNGWHENPWEKVKEASLLLLSSDIEGFGLVMIEALSRGIPAVSTKCDGPLEIIQNDKNGWLFERGNYLELQSILQEIIDGSKRLPDISDCKDSVTQYNSKIVVDAIEEILYSYFIMKELKEQFSSSRYFTENEIINKIYKIMTENKINLDVIFSVLDTRYSDKNKSSWLTRLGKVFWNEQLLDFVIPAFQKALTYNPNNREALYHLGNILMSIGEEELGTYYLNKAGDTLQVDSK